MVIRLAHDQHVDWPTVVADLQAQGYDLKRIAKHTGASDQRIRKWVQIACQPRHDDGVRLIALWCFVTGKRDDSVPVVSRYA